MFVKASNTHRNFIEMATRKSCNSTEDLMSIDHPSQITGLPLQMIKIIKISGFSIIMPHAL
jgi:hypothetical protein